MKRIGGFPFSLQWKHNISTNTSVYCPSTTAGWEHISTSVRAATPDLLNGNEPFEATAADRQHVSLHQQTATQSGSIVYHIITGSETTKTLAAVPPLESRRFSNWSRAFRTSSDSPVSSFASACTVSGFTVRSFRVAADTHHQSPAPAGSTDPLIGPRQTLAPSEQPDRQPIGPAGAPWKPRETVHWLYTSPADPDRELICLPTVISGSTEAANWLLISAAKQTEIWLVDVSVVVCLDGEPCWGTETICSLTLK